MNPHREHAVLTLEDLEREATRMLEVHETLPTTNGWPTAAGLIGCNVVQVMACRKTNGRRGRIEFRYKVNGRRAARAAIFAG